MSNLLSMIASQGAGIGSFLKGAKYKDYQNERDEKARDKRLGFEAFSSANDAMMGTDRNRINSTVADLSQYNPQGASNLLKLYQNQDTRTIQDVHNAGLMALSLGDSEEDNKKKRETMAHMGNQLYDGQLKDMVMGFGDPNSIPDDQLDQHLMSLYQIGVQTGALKPPAGGKDDRTKEEKLFDARNNNPELDKHLTKQEMNTPLAKDLLQEGYTSGSPEFKAEYRRRKLAALDKKGGVTVNNNNYPPEDMIEAGSIPELTPSESSLSIEELKLGLGPKASVKQFVNNVLGFMVEGVPNEDVEKSRTQLRVMNQKLKKFLTVNARGAAFDVANVAEILPNFDILQDPDALEIKLNSIYTIVDDSLKAKEAILRDGSVKTKQLVNELQGDINRLKEAKAYIPKPLTALPITPDNLAKYTIADLKKLDQNSLSTEELALFTQRVDQLLTQQSR